MHHPEIANESPADSADLESAPKASRKVAWIVVGIVVAAASLAGYFLFFGHAEAQSGEAAVTSKSDSEKTDSTLVKIDEKQKSAVSLQTVETKNFQAEHVCTGKIAFNEDLMTPVFAEFTGRVTKVFAKPGDAVKRGAPLYEIETLDLVQAETDLISAVANLRKAENALKLAESSKDIAARNIDISNRSIDISKRNVEISNLSAKLSELNQERQKGLVEDKAVAEKDYEQAQRDLQSALRDTQSAMRDSEQALKDMEQAKRDQKQAESDIESAKTDIAAGGHIITAVRDRLKGIFGKSDEEIDTLLKNRVVDRIVSVKAPIAGTITARKIGLGQYIKPDNSDPLFTIADMSSMWLVADVYEVDAPNVHEGDAVEVELLAYPGEVFSGKVAYIGAAVNPDTRRVAVRCTIPNEGRLLKAEMYATFRILSGDGKPMPSVPANSVVREGNKDVVYVAKSDLEFEKRTIVTGQRRGSQIQVLDGLKAGERVVSDGAIFLNNSDAN